MCGFLGILNAKRLPASAKSLGESLRHRGPDDHGEHVDDTAVLAHRRLSIIDIKSGHQPIYNEDRSRCIVFNGEIYNYRELRAELAALGRRTATHSDTEVILQAYEEFGEECVSRLRGMFAFAIWDQARRELFVARDRLGIKPLFYASIGDTFYFASEMKAILQFADFPRDMDPDALATFLQLAYIPAPLTIYRHIRKLPPAHLLKVDAHGVRLRKYWDLHFEPRSPRSHKALQEEIVERLREAVDYRLVSDVPVGAFLSGGVDSGAVVSLMSNLDSSAVRTFSIGFGGDAGGYLDERTYAREIAERYGTRHEEFEVVPAVHRVLTEIVDAFDEPFGDSATIPTYYVSQLTRQHVKVALSGLGGDEMFGGYERYLGFNLSRAYNLLPRLVRERLILPALERLPERADGHYTINHLKRFARSASRPDGERYVGFASMLDGSRLRELFGASNPFATGIDTGQDLLLDHFNNAPAAHPMDRMFYCDLKTYVPEDILACTDRMSMRHSLEVRVPFLDHEFVEFCATIPHRLKIKRGRKKYILKQALEPLLPRSVLTHRKQGFVGPMTTWLRGDLRSFATKTLSRENLNRHGVFDPRFVKQLLDDHFEGKEIHDKLIWSLMVFQTWYDRYIDRRPPEIPPVERPRSRGAAPIERDG